MGISRWRPPLQLHGLLGPGPGPQTRTPLPHCILILCVLSLVGLSVARPALCPWLQHPMQTPTPTCPDAQGPRVSLTLGSSNLSEVSLSPSPRVCNGLGPGLFSRDLVCTRILFLYPFLWSKRIFLPLRRDKYLKNLIISPLGYGLKRKKKTLGY